ncbi:NAD(P)H-dependent oxidoreductase [Epilithonimonas arachidiradicis]|uniref:Potassium transporter KefG n=1 Tax=Epilithonimonas arachidiradicis TaxID=1617282 RepID=A0ABQ1X5R6_9FLAO|nr:NAD(P)H-dependent oxidoreductase [Epilithonimonas arachidiradicis]GGG57249.1 potassium transporter KefG [Epilithonimonas arachidiradicis]
MKKTLVLFAHPYFEHSTTNVRLLECYNDLDNVTFRDLYEDYPDFHIQPFRERKRIVEYERIIFHFPIIWFGLPPLLKLWIDEVFDMRWISESGLNILSGKDAIIITTVGGRENNYTLEGKYKTGVEELLTGLKVSLDVNNIELKKLHIIYNADNLEDQELDLLCNELYNILKIK